MAQGRSRTADMNRLLAILSQYPLGRTTAQLSEATNLPNRYIVGLLDYEPHNFVIKSYSGANTTLPTTLWTLQKYIKGSLADEELKTRIEAGSKVEKEA